KDDRPQSREKACAGNLSRLLQRTIDLMVAAHCWPESQNEEAGKVRIQDDPDRVVDLDAGEGNWLEEKQQRGNRQNHARERIGQFYAQIDQPHPPLPAPGNQIADGYGDGDREDGRCDRKAEAVEEGPAGSVMLEKHETVIVQSRSLGREWDAIAWNQRGKQKAEKRQDKDEHDQKPQRGL